MARIRAYFSKRPGQYQNKAEHVPVRITAREPVLLDPGRPSLAHLPNDVVLRILSFIDDLHTIASLSSAFYEKARYVQHHTVHIDLNQRSKARGHLEILSRNLLPAVRVLEVSGKTQDEGDEILTRLLNILPGMTGLRDLHWHSIPLSILDHVPTRVRLHTSVTCKDTGDELEEHLQHEQARALLAQLADNQNLFSLSVRLPFLHLHECRSTMHALKRVLLSCPRLVRIPMLNVGYACFPPHGVVDGPPLGAPYCGLGLSGGERPQALEEFSVERYPWGREPFGVNNSVYTTGYPEQGTEMHYWAETFDWSRLQRLNDIRSDLAMEIAPRLMCLKEVVITDRWHCPWDKTAFLEEIPTALERISIQSWGDVGNKPGPITRHGAALRRLEMHLVGRPWAADRLVTDTGLAALCNGLPHLEELAIDIARDKSADWPYSSLDIIARFPCLRTVQLWFQLDRPAPLIPHLTVSAAHQLFGYLRKRNRNIQRLVLCSGTPALFTFFGEPTWTGQNSIRLVCEVSYYDSNAASVTCPDLNTEMNKELNRLAKGDREAGKGMFEGATGLLLRVALDGPLTMDEWEAWRKLESVRLWRAYRRQRSVFRRFVSWALSCNSGT
jgi:hypothetical protein